MIILSQGFVCFCGHAFLFLLGKYPELLSLGHMVFPEWLYCFTLSAEMYERSNSSYCCQHLVSSSSGAILAGENYVSLWLKSHFLEEKCHWAPFHIFIGHSSPCIKSLNILSILNRLFVFLLLNHRAFKIHILKIIIYFYSCKILSPICGLLIYFTNNF